MFKVWHWSFLVFLLTTVMGNFAKASASACANAFLTSVDTKISVDVFDSDFKTRKLSKRSIELTNVVQISERKISDGKTDIELIDTEFGSIDLKHLIKGEAPTLIEKYVLQTLFAAEKARAFYTDIGVDLGSFHIRLQDPSTPPLADRVGDVLSFTKMKSLEPIEGSSLNISDALEMVSDVVYHEITHLAQGRQTLALSDSLLGTTAYEGHANLMAWLISGRTDLGALGAVPASMQVFTRAKFGAHIVTDSAPYVYSDYQPFSSVLVRLHNEIVRSTSVEKEKEHRHKVISRIYFEIVSAANGTETYQDLLKSVVEKLQHEDLITPQTLTSFVSDLRIRGLNLNDPKDEGYTSGILINGHPPDRGMFFAKNEARKDGTSKPSIEVQPGFFRIRPELKGPLLGIITSESTTAAFNLTFQTAYQKRMQQQPMPTKNEIQSLFYQVMKETSSPGVADSGMLLRPGIVEISDSSARVEFDVDFQNCNPGASAFLPMMIYTPDWKTVGLLNLPLICK